MIKIQLELLTGVLARGRRGQFLKFQQQTCRIKALEATFGIIVMLMISVSFDYSSTIYI